MMIGKNKEEGRVCTVLFHIYRKSLTRSENRLAAILSQKSLSPSWDSNPACPVRMPLLYPLRQSQRQL